MKKLFALGAAALLAFGLAACEQKTPTQQPTEGTQQPTQPAVQGKTIKLVYSGTESDKDFNLGLFEDFKAARKAAGDPNTYEITYVGHGPDKVDSEIIDWGEDASPDVYEFASDKLSILYQKSALAIVTGKNKAYIQENMTDLAIACATFNESYYAYPYTGDNTYYLQYDKSIISAEEAKDMMTVMDVAHEKGYKVAYNLTSGFYGAAAMFTFGADYNIGFNEDGSIVDIKADFNGANGVKAAKACMEIINHPAWVDSAAVASKSDKIAAVIAGTWEIANLKKVYAENYACAVMPTVTVDDETKNLGAFLGGKLLGVNPQRSAGDTDRLKAAHELAKFLSDKECQLKRFKHAGIGPCHKAAASDPEVVASPNNVVLNAQTLFAHEQSSVPAGVWSAPNVIFTAMKPDTKPAEKCTEENLQAFLDAYNNTVTKK